MVGGCLLWFAIVPKRASDAANEWGEGKAAGNVFTDGEDDELFLSRWAGCL